MKRIIFSLMLLLCVGSVFGQNADEFMKRWKARSGMKYENMTKKVKKVCKENPDVATWTTKKVQVVRGEVSGIESKQLQKDLDALEGFKCVYYEKRNDDFDLFRNIQYYAIEDGEYITELVVRIDINVEMENPIVLIHFQGKIKKEDVPNLIDLKQNTKMTVRK